MNVLNAGMQRAPSLTERNYYADEVKIVNPCYPENIGRFGEQGTPENGWFETILNCRNESALYTTYNALIEDDTLGYLTNEKSKITGIVKTNFIYIHTTSVEPKCYSYSDALKYANGMIEVMAGSMQGRVFLQQSNNCIFMLAKEIELPTSNAISTYHFYFPYIRVVKVDNGWCFNKP